MDCSPEYVRMCEAAFAVQRRHDGFKEGDWVWDGEKVFCIGSDVWGVVKYMRKASTVHVPSIRPLEAQSIKAFYGMTVAELIDRAKNGPEIDAITFQRRDIYNPVKLFRQDQLQEIVISDFVSAGKLAIAFGDWYEDYGTPGGSMEALWLEFVMHTLYHKRWDGSVWVNESLYP